MKYFKIMKWLLLFITLPMLAGIPVKDDRMGLRGSVEAPPRPYVHYALDDAAVAGALKGVR